MSHGPVGGCDNRSRARQGRSKSGKTQQQIHRRGASQHYAHADHADVHCGRLNARNAPQQPLGVEIGGQCGTRDRDGKTQQQIPYELQPAGRIIQLAQHRKVGQGDDDTSNRERGTKSQNRQLKQRQGPT